MTPPIISVCICTYNHKDYIAAAIKGVLTQKINVPIELIIADDCSTDGSADIIENFDYGNVPVNLILHKKNIGPWLNWTGLLKAAKGKYIAYFEGDDYWVDTNKLQKQLDYLEENPREFLVSHQISTLEKGQIVHEGNTPKEYTFKQFAVAGCAGIYTCSFFFRNNNVIADIFNKNWIYNLDGSDHLFLLLATLNDGKVYQLPENMAVYRKHATGVWTSSNNIKKAMGGLLNNYLYKKHLPIKQKERMYFDWNDRKHLTQIIYAQRRPLPAVINRVINKALSTLPDLVGMRIYSAILHPLYLKAYNIHFEDSDGK